MNTFDVKGIDRALFDLDSQDFASSSDTGFVRTTVGLMSNVANLKFHIMRINNLDEFAFSNLAGIGADFDNNALTSLAELGWQTSGQFILSDTTALSHFLPQFDIFRWLINSVLEFTVEAGAIDVKGNDIVGADDIFFSGVGHELRSTSGGLEARVASGDTFKIFRGGAEEYAFGAAANMRGNNINEIAALIADVPSQNITFSSFEVLYQAGSGHKHNFYLGAVNYVQIAVQELKLINNSIIDFDGNRISLSASAGFASDVPTKPVAYVDIQVGGAPFKMPYFSP